jgi:hypothetical protein
MSEFYNFAKKIFGDNKDIYSEVKKALLNNQVIYKTFACQIFGIKDLTLENEAHLLLKIRECLKRKRQQEQKNQILNELLPIHMFNYDMNYPLEMLLKDDWTNSNEFIKFKLGFYHCPLVYFILKYKNESREHLKNLFYDRFKINEFEIFLKEYNSNMLLLKDLYLN